MSDRILVMGSEAGAFNAEIKIDSLETRDEDFVSTELFNQKTLRCSQSSEGS